MLKYTVYEIFQQINIPQDMIENQAKTYTFKKGVKATLVQSGKKEIDYEKQEEKNTSVVYKLTDGNETLYMMIHGEFWSYDGLKATSFEFVTPVEKTVTVFEKA